MEKITLLLDCVSVPHFSNRMVEFLSGQKPGIVIERLSIPVDKYFSFRLAWELIRSHAKIVHYLWGGHHPLVYILSKISGKKVIVHWIGTDVLIAASKKRNRISGVLWKIAHGMVDKHLAVSEPLSDELKSIGIESEIVSLIPDMPESNNDFRWPVRDRILVYLPEDNIDIHKVDIICRLMRELKHIEFLIISNSGEGLPQLPNVQYMGKVKDMESVWKQIKIYLRLTKHDGLPHMVLEALARRKHVVWTYKFPYCYEGRTFEESRDAIIAILNQDKPNIDGMYYVNSHFNPSKIIESLKQKYLEVLSI